jgi:hypothetical protein
LVVHEFVCADCKVDVFCWSGPVAPTRCAPCETVRDIKARDRMSPEAEAELRELLGCELPKEDEAT